MLTCCLKCKRNTKNKDAELLETKNGRLLLPPKYAACGCEKSRFIKGQEA